MKHKTKEVEKMTVNQKKKQELDVEIMLYVNRKLYDGGHITEEMFHRAKEEFLKRQ